MENLMYNGYFIIGLVLALIAIFVIVMLFVAIQHYKGDIKYLYKENQRLEELKQTLGGRIDQERKHYKELVLYLASEGEEKLVKEFEKLESEIEKQIDLANNDESRITLIKYLLNKHKEATK